MSNTQICTPPGLHTPAWLPHVLPNTPLHTPLAFILQLDFFMCYQTPHYTLPWPSPSSLTSSCATKHPTTHSPGLHPPARLLHVLPNTALHTPLAFTLQLDFFMCYQTPHYTLLWPSPSSLTSSCATKHHTTHSPGLHPPA